MTIKKAKTATQSEAKLEKVAPSAVTYRVVNAEGAEVGSMELDGEVFGAKIHTAITHDAVVWQLNKRRAGTHSTLTKGAMRGGNRKPWRQKGTGRARAGSNTSPIWVGGGIAHGPHPHSYETRLSKRARVQALCAVLSDKVKESTLVILDKLEMPTAKTKQMAKIFNAIGVKGKVNFLFPVKGKELSTVAAFKASRNLESIFPMSLDGVNVYDLLKNKYLMSTVAGITALQEMVKARQ